MRKSALFKKESALFAWLTIALVCPSERYETVAEGLLVKRFVSSPYFTTIHYI